MANHSFKTGDTVKYNADAYNGRKETNAVILRQLKEIALNFDLVQFCLYF